MPAPDVESGRGRFGGIPEPFPCPYCDSTLSMDDVCCSAEDGHEVLEGSKAPVAKIEIWCSWCGYVYEENADDLNWPSRRQFEAFMSRARQTASELREEGE